MKVRGKEDDTRGRSLTLFVACGSLACVIERTCSQHEVRVQGKSRNPMSMVFENMKQASLDRRGY